MSRSVKDLVIFNYFILLFPLSLYSWINTGWMRLRSKMKRRFTLYCPSLFSLVEEGKTNERPCLFSLSSLSLLFSATLGAISLSLACEITHHPLTCINPTPPNTTFGRHTAQCSVWLALVVQNRLSLSRLPGTATESVLLPKIDISRVGARIIDELVRAMRDIDLDDVELACVKALVFFDPSECNFSDALSSAKLILTLFQMPKVSANLIRSLAFGDKF